MTQRCHFFIEYRHLYCAHSPRVTGTSNISDLILPSWNCDTGNFASGPKDLYLSAPAQEYATSAFY